MNRGGNVRKSNIGLVLILVGTLCGCATTEQSLRAKGLTPLTQRDLEERFSKGVKVRFDNNTGGRGVASYKPDGTAQVEFPGGADTGKWRVKDSKICVTWTKLRNGEEGCFITYKTGPKEYTSFTADGTLNATSTDID
jgi:hypothetical protein